MLVSRGLGGANGWEISLRVVGFGSLLVGRFPSVCCGLRQVFLVR